MDDPSKLQPVVILIDELRHDDMQIRLSAFRKLDFIAKALGPVRTREELIPYLSEFIDDEDDVLLILAESLARFLPFVGGAEYADILFGPLEILAGLGEAGVRDKAVEAVVSVSQELTPDTLVQHMVPMLRRLCNGEWFTSRISACSLCATPYTRVPAECQQDLVQLYAQLCKDETPMVRRAACAQLGKIIEVMNYQDINSHIFASYCELAKDEQDSVRLIAAQVCADIVRIYRENDNVSAVLPVAVALCGDQSWRVRYMVADKFSDILGAIGDALDDDNAQVLMGGFSQILGDAEPEVRTAAAFKIAEVAKVFGPSKIYSLLGPIKALANDSCQYTRAALGSAVAAIPALVSRRQDVMDHILPTILQLLKDSDPEVRLNVISNIDTVNDVIGLEMLSQSLLPAVRELALDQKWRVRLAMVQHIPDLAKRLGPAFFDDKLSSLSMEWLRDPVFSIREAATTNLMRLSEAFGSEWSEKNIVPKIDELASSPHFIARLTALNAIKGLAVVLGQKTTAGTLVNVCISLADDPVPNVRFNVAKTLKAIHKILPSETSEEQLVPLLTELAADDDVDVRYFAQDALFAIAPNHEISRTFASNQSVAQGYTLKLE